MSSSDGGETWDGRAADVFDSDSETAERGHHSRRKM
jgi:hypothetical protein